MKNKYCVIAGMPRAGTTFLYHQLQKHPDIFVPFRKEVSYFSVFHDRGVHWYDNLYRDAARHQVRLDVSPLCFMDDGSERLMAEFDRDMKVVLVIRAPVDWGLSFYAQILSHEYNVPVFKQFLEGYDLRMGRKILKLRFLDGFITRRIQEFRNVFKHNLLIFSMRLLRNDPVRMLKTIERFLDIKPWFTGENFRNEIINAGSRKHIKFISYLLSRESFISIVEKTVPRSAVLYARKMAQQFNSESNHTKTFKYSDQDRELSARLFAEQQSEIDTLFRFSDIISGDGSPYNIQTGL